MQTDTRLTPTVVRERSTRDKAVIAWLAIGVAGYAVLPWYMLQDSVLALRWLGAFTSRENAPALLQAALHGRAWLWPIGTLLVLAIVALAAPSLDRIARGNALIVLGVCGFAWTALQGFAIGPRGFAYEWLHEFGNPAGQYGVGIGTALVLTSFAMLFALGLAKRGRFRGDGFVAGCVVGIALLIGVFTFYPLYKVLVSALQASSGEVSINAFVTRLFTEKIWGLGCVGGRTRCGVAWNTLMLALSCAIACTLLGLAFALIVTRTRLRFRKTLRILSVLPIITPPFVIGLGLILLFGRSGLVNQFLEFAFGIEPTRWIYGFQGVLLAQVFAFTPIAFLVLIGVVEGIAPSLEEAAQTLRADRWTTFTTVSLPLMRPGLANAFLISFIESIADFGNPILLGGNFGVLSTEIFFSVVGAQLDQGRAATLGIVLLAFALCAFLVQRRVLGRRVYTAMSGKGDAGIPAPLPQRIRIASYALAFPWAFLTIVIYVMALVGGFVETWGRDYTPTLKHYIKAFGIESGPNGVIWAGAAWNSFWTTVRLAAIAAPLTAALGIVAAYLLTRQRFVGRSAFEFGTLLSFAVPGTVIGISYILAFNVPPIEITGTAIILVACNVFRNMPVGVRAGIASMAQIDKSLDEAAMTLRARGWTTLRTIVLPLLKPAIIAALVYSFVRAMTTVSAVIFLVSAEYEWATTYIINRVINGDYGVAIAYCSVLIVLMIVVILAIHYLVGERRLGRRAADVRPAAALAGRAAA
ncbi:MAG TPA: iron ABC transporter permease [Casimicrobiaceae bacterium]|nr:iron ABC transporter permease [Casimicrobiaceae bacterium]